MSEARRDAVPAAGRQLTFDPCSAQNQRRALTFKNGLVFGATVVGDRYYAIWDDDNRVVRVIHHFHGSKLKSEKTMTQVMWVSNRAAFSNSYTATYFCARLQTLWVVVDNVFRECERYEGKMKFKERWKKKCEENGWRVAFEPTASSPAGSSHLGSKLVFPHVPYTFPATNGYRATGKLSRNNKQSKGFLDRS